MKLEDSLRVKIQRKIRDCKPLDTIDDRVGVRFVVLLTEQIKQVEAVIEGLGHAFTKDRDYESERNARPLEFAYQSVHLVVRPKEPLQHGEIVIPKDLACEVQIRTLLQHAHSELTHDRLYKARSLSASEPEPRGSSQHGPHRSDRQYLLGGFEGARGHGSWSSAN